MKYTKALSTRSALFAALMGICLSLACGEEAMVLEMEEADEERSSSTQHGAIITPEFQLSGLDEVPRELSIERLGLAISEIRLEPLEGQGGIAYSTSEPFHLHFDLASGQNSLQRSAVELPETGQFLVSVRLEPLNNVNDDDYLGGSLGMIGMIRNESFDAGQECDDQGLTNGIEEDKRQSGEENDGDPVPLPFDRIRGLEPGEWTSFRYTSDQIVFYTFTDVELVAGEQVLTFDFNLRQYANAVVEPLMDNVEKYLGETELDQEFLDITHEYQIGELDTVGPESLMDAGSVSAQYMR